MEMAGVGYLVDLLYLSFCRLLGQADKIEIPLEVGAVKCCGHLCGVL